MSSRSRYQVPEGLRPLLEGLARETIRCQPKDLITFGQLFFDELQRQRECNPNTDIISNPITYDMFRTDLHRRHWKFASSVQGKSSTSSRSHQLEVLDVDVRLSPRVTKHKHLEQSENNSRCQSPMDQAAIKIQAAFRGHVVRAHPEKYGLEKTMSRTHSSEKMTTLNNKKDQKRHSVGGYSLEMDTPEDRAATKIQAEIRGFLARKHVEKMKKEENDSATKIQARIRGFLTRKHLDEQGLLSPSRSRSSVHSSQSDLLDN